MKCFPRRALCPSFFGKLLVGRTSGRACPPKSAENAVLLPFRVSRAFRLVFAGRRACFSFDHFRAERHRAAISHLRFFCRTSAAPLHFCRKRWLGAVLVAMAVSTCIRRALCPCFHARASVRDPARQGASGERRQKHGLGDSFGCAGSAGLILIVALQRFRSCAAQRGKSPRRTAFLRSTRSARVQDIRGRSAGGSILRPSSGTTYFGTARQPCRIRHSSRPGARRSTACWARENRDRCTSSPIFLQNIRGTAAFLPEALARCRFGSEGRFEVLSPGTLPVFLRKSFGQKNVRQSVLGEKCRKRRLAAVSRLASVSTGFRWALSLYFIRTPPREKVPGGALPSPIFLQNIRSTAAFLPEALAWCRFGRDGRFDMRFKGAVPSFLRAGFGARFRAAGRLRRKAPKARSWRLFRLRGRCWSDFHRGLAAFSIACSAARRVTSADRLFAQRVVCRGLGCPRQVCRGGFREPCQIRLNSTSKLGPAGRPLGSDS